MSGVGNNSTMQNGTSSSRTVALARQSSITNRRVLTRGETLPASVGSSNPPISVLSGTSHSMSQGGNHLGADGRLVDYESLISHFDCPVCHDWVTPPVVQCRKGHIVCGPCKSKGLKACPICKQRFSDVPNLMIEQVSAVIAFPCRFQSHGCREYSDLLHKTAHESLCSYRPVGCLYSVRGCTQVLLYHLMEEHVPQCQFKPPPPVTNQVSRDGLGH